MRIPLARWNRKRRGQALVVVAFLMLFVVSAVFVTFSIGHRVREKIKLQAAADSIAYSNAVVQARAFNFYAVSNRALVAHMISILSIHAYQSYLSWYEDALAASVRAFIRIYERFSTGVPPGCGGCPALRRASAANAARLIAQDLLNPPGGNPNRDYTSCAYKNCVALVEKNLVFRRGARWLHEQYHAKMNNNFCANMVIGSRNHYAKLQMIRAHQVNVERDLMRLMSGVRTNTHDDVFTPGHFIDVRNMAQKILDTRPLPHYEYDTDQMPHTASIGAGIATRFDRRLEWEPASGAKSVDYYRAAVSNQVDGPRQKLHRDYDEVLHATRFPRWVTARGYKLDMNIQRYRDRIDELARPHYAQLTLENYGSSRFVPAWQHQDPGTANTQGGKPPTNFKLPRICGEDDYEKDPARCNVLNFGGQTNQWFSESVQDEPSHRMTQIMRSQARSGDLAIATADWGTVTGSMRPGGCSTSCRVTVEVEQHPGRNGIWADSDDWARTNENAPDIHSIHFFHAYSADVLAHQFGGSENGPLGERTYRGHMRFRLNQNNGLWGMPRTVAGVYKSTNDIARKNNGVPHTWEMNIPSLALLGPFQTVDPVGDRALGRRMAAVAGGLTYYHNPNLAIGWREPPNLWNPFWRAKLHPIRADDAADVLTAAQPSGVPFVNQYGIGH